MSSRLRVLALALLAMWACGEADTDSTLEEQSEALAESRLGAAVYVQDSGHTSRYVYHGVTSESFWVDLNVRNAAANKEVGIVWTKDGWQTNTKTRASFEASLGGSRERWGVDVADFANVWGGQGIEVEYAAYVTMNGKTEWSPLRNHYIYEVVTPEKPVRLLRSSAVLTGALPHLTGSVRALNVTTPRRVFVRYTTNAWASFAETQASFDGKDFTFDVALPFAQTTDKVEFAVRLEAEGASFWDNRNGQNYAHQLAPALNSQIVTPQTDVGLSGYLLFDASVLTDLGVSAARLRVDGGAPINLPLQGGYVPYQFVQGFSAQGSVRWVLSLADFAPGAHQVALEVDAGPFRRNYPALPFTVDDTLSSVASYALAAGTTAWDADQGADGALYVGTDRQVLKYDAIGDASPSLAFVETPLPSYLFRVTVDDAGRVYALHGSAEAVRWLADGSLDTSFGDQGVLRLTATYGSSTLCFPADFAAVGDALVIVDSCNARVLRLTLDGAFVSEFSVKSQGYDFAAGLYEGDALWLSVSRFDDAGQHSALLALDGDFAVQETVEIDQSAGYVESFAVGPDAVWTSSYDSTLYELSLAGVLQTGFSGVSGDLELPGSHSGLTALRVLEDGTVLGLDRTGNDLELVARPVL